MKELFIKWVSLPQSQSTIQKLIDEVKRSPKNLLNTTLSPFLTSQKTNLSTVGPLNLSGTLKPTPHTPPKSPNDFGIHENYIKSSYSIVGKMKGLSGAADSADSSFENSPRQESVPCELNLH